jgi:hypothetical protein
MKKIIKHPSAWIPLVMSLVAFTIVIIRIIIFGFVREADEGTAAHIWQLLVVIQIPIVIFFTVKWLPRNTKQALIVLVLQANAILISLAAVFIMECRT